MYTRPSLNVDPRGPAIPNLLHRYLLLSRTDRARVTKAENGQNRPPGHGFGREFVKSELFFAAHLSEGILGRTGEATAPKCENHDFEFRRNS